MFGDEFVLRKSSVFRCIAHQFSDRLLALRNPVVTAWRSI